MQPSTIDGHVAEGRRAVADLLDGLDAADWEVASLCRGWTVRHVAAHLTHAVLPIHEVLRAAARSGFRFDVTIDRMARDDARAPSGIVADLRDAAGSRRRPPLTSPMEPLIDVLVHTQDICRPLGLERAMPVEAAAAAARRVWGMGFPFHARRRWAGVRLVATDADFAVGEGRETAAPIGELLMLLTGRDAAPLA